MKAGINIYLHPADTIEVKPALQPGQFWMRIAGRQGAVLLTMEQAQFDNLRTAIRKYDDASS